MQHQEIMPDTSVKIFFFQLPVVQADDEDIVEHHSKRSVQVMEQFSDLSFIPCSFVAKDSSRKKRRSLKIPSTPSHDPVSTSHNIRPITYLLFYCKTHIYASF